MVYYLENVKLANCIIKNFCKCRFIQRKIVANSQAYISFSFPRTYLITLAFKNNSFLSDYVFAVIAIVLFVQ